MRDRSWPRIIGEMATELMPVVVVTDDGREPALPVPEFFEPTTRVPLPPSEPRTYARGPRRSREMIAALPRDWIDQMRTRKTS